MAQKRSKIIKEKPKIIPSMKDDTRCPRCSSALKNIDNTLVCDKCRTKYSVSEGVPIMMIQPTETAS